MNYADIRFYELFYEYFDDVEASKKVLLKCPKLLKCCEKVYESGKKYFENRPVTKF